MMYRKLPSLKFKYDPTWGLVTYRGSWPVPRWLHERLRKRTVQTNPQVYVCQEAHNTSGALHLTSERDRRFTLCGRRSSGWQSSRIWADSEGFRCPSCGLAAQESRYVIPDGF